MYNDVESIGVWNVTPDPRSQVEKKERDRILNNVFSLYRSGAQLAVSARLPSEGESEPEERFSEGGILDMLDVSELLSWSMEVSPNVLKSSPIIV